MKRPKSAPLPHNESYARTVNGCPDLPFLPVVEAASLVENPDVQEILKILRICVIDVIFSSGDE